MNTDLLTLLTELSKIDILAVIGAITSICAGLIVIFSLIPGEQPEKFLKGVVAVLSKISRK